jgi:spore germination protein YaaH
MKKIIILLILFIICKNAIAQNYKSTIQEQAEYYNQLGQKTIAQYDSINKIAKNMNAEKMLCTLNKRVYGWHPYWMGSAYTNYQWNLISDLSFFGYDVNYTDGNATSTHGWSSDPVVPAAISNGVNVTLTATLFGDHATFFANNTAKQTLITNLINLVQARNANGVNIDFEGVPASEKTNFANFMADLCDQMHTAIPGSEVSMALYAVDWNNVFDFTILVPKVDLFIIMGYDYYYSGSSTAGPVDPLYSLTSGYDYNLTKSITYYLNKGVPNNKLILGLPYYGRQWSVSAFPLPATTTGNSTSKTYKVLRDNTSGYYNTKIWNSTTQTPYYNFSTGGSDYQCWGLDNTSLGKRLDLINNRNIAGMGIWALGYDDGYTDLWNTIKDKISNCMIKSCADTIWDMGGPSRNYYNNENYTYTIAPDGAVGVSLNFTQFDVEANFDYLYIYDGSSIAAPLIGTYTGTNSPGLINSTGNALTLRFTSDNATTKPGFTAIQSCIIDNTKPTTSIATSGTWQTNDFTATFTDIDPVPNATGIKYKMYQVASHNSPWRSNANKEFFNDDFEGTSIHSDWTNYAGTWSIASNQLFQSDESNANTILTASLPQNSFNQYLYHFTAKINGTGTNRRAGLHFMCSNANSTNRGNSYFIYFRADSDLLQIYDVSADVFTLRTDVVKTFDVDVFYDFKILYDKTTGEILVYINDILSAQWIDTTPLTTGSYVSWRSGNCTYTVDDFRVYHNRNSTTLVSVCDASDEIQYSNPMPTDASGMIRSIVIDNAKNISSIAQNLVNIDCTVPNTIVGINDGLSSDLDEQVSTSTLSANFAASSDPNSGIIDYEYAIGTSPGSTDIRSFTSTSAALSFSASGLSLINGITYYVTIRAKNAAGLYSTLASSDGITINVLLPLTFIDFTAKKINKHQVELNFTTTDETNVEKIELMYSYDGVNFENLQTFQPKNNVNQINTYTFIHNKDTKNKTIYYKVLSIDYSSNIIVSPIRSVSFYENITIRQIQSETLSFMVNTNNEIPVKIEILDINGKIIFSEKKNLQEGKNIINYSNITLSKGLYNIVITTEDNTLFSNKFIR